MSFEKTSLNVVCLSFFTAVGEVLEHRIAFVLTIALQATLHALESQRILIGAVAFGESSHIVDALEEVGNLAFGGLRVASPAIRRQASLVELLHLSFTQSPILETVDQCLQPIDISQQITAVSNLSEYFFILTSRLSKFPAFFL